MGKMGKMGRLIGLLLVLHLLQGSAVAQSDCPYMQKKTYEDHIPKGNLTAGGFSKLAGVTDLHQCVELCCLAAECNVVLMYDQLCYHIDCASNELCLPVPIPNPHKDRQVKMVLVKPVGMPMPWSEVLRRHSFGSMKTPPIFSEGNPDPGSALFCQPDERDQCRAGEECVQMVKSPLGYCRCLGGVPRDRDGLCPRKPVPRQFAAPFKPLLQQPQQQHQQQTEDLARLNERPPVQKLTVSSASKQIRLPENEATLTVYAYPEAPVGKKYQYYWQLLRSPEGTNGMDTIKEQSGTQLKLTKLEAGEYSFKVTVNGTDAYGESIANLTVLPAQRINQPPQVIVNPPNQIVKLPNTGAILDASSSNDDDGIVSFHWELQQGPLGYEPKLSDVAMLQLDNLNIPGNYTFKVTVTDKNQLSNSTTANITVLKVIDYPPQANPGRDVIVNLPHNNVTLNGSLSSDDRQIVSWEWTKSPSDVDKAADMQDTRTPFLKLSHLEEGMYTFTLKVTDAANQSNSAEVHVFVKPPTNDPPTADAGGNITISLPQTWVVLDGSKSKDDNKIAAFKWTRLSGPSDVTFVSANASRTNVTGLTKGTYVFALNVTDDSGNVVTDKAVVLVGQNKNQAPKADAGGDQNIQLPRNVVILNGSRSSDDLKIASWLWERDDSSLAVGDIVGDSAHSPVLIFTNFLPGRYVFRLTVTDGEGLTGQDTASVMVHEDALLAKLVQLKLEVDLRALTQAQYATLLAKLELLLVKDGSQMRIRRLYAEPGTGRVTLVFYLEASDGSISTGNSLVHHLKQKLAMDAGLLGFSVVSVQTVICQNSCSNHGVCNEQTRRCMCEAFWMQNLFRLFLGDGEADCQWSVLYVVIGLISGAVALVAVCWLVAWLCYSHGRLKVAKKKPQAYALLNDSDEQAVQYGNKTTLFESDSDSDVMFETRDKNAILMKNEAAKNGYTKATGKVGRRVKS